MYVVCHSSGIRVAVQPYEPKTPTSPTGASPLGEGQGVNMSSRDARPIDQNRILPLTRDFAMRTQPPASPTGVGSALGGLARRSRILPWNSGTRAQSKGEARTSCITISESSPQNTALHPSPYYTERSPSWILDRSGLTGITTWIPKKKGYFPERSVHATGWHLKTLAGTRMELVLPVSLAERVSCR